MFRHSEDTWLFAFHLFSHNLRIVDRPQDVLMTVRASSVHGPRANIHAVEDIGAVVDWLTERCEFQADAKSNLGGVAYPQ